MNSNQDDNNGPPTSRGSRHFGQPILAIVPDDRPPTSSGSIGPLVPDNYLFASNHHVGPYDVMCGRHKEAFNNIGNRRFRVTISLSLDRYLSAKTKADKGKEILHIIGIVHQNGGKFIKWDKQRGWIELAEKQAREKCGHALRDMAAARDLTKSTKAQSHQRSRRGKARTAFKQSMRKKNASGLKQLASVATRRVDEAIFSGQAAACMRSMASSTFHHIPGGSSGGAVGGPQVAEHAQLQRESSTSGWDHLRDSGRRSSLIRGSIHSTIGVGDVDHHLSDVDRENVEDDSKSNVFMNLFEQQLDLSQSSNQRRNR